MPDLVVAFLKRSMGLARPQITERFPPVIATISNYDLLSDTLCVVTHYDTSVIPALRCLRPFGFRHMA